MLNLQKTTGAFRGKLIIRAYGHWINGGKSLLDIGCGTGNVGKQIGDHFHLRVTGCDLKNYLEVDLPIVLMRSKTKLPFATKQFDYAMINDTLHHIDPALQVKLLQDSLRVAKKVLIFEVEPTLLGSTFDIILNKMHYDGLYIPLAFRSKNDWRELFKSLNVAIEVKRVQRPLLYPFNHVAFCLTPHK